MSKWSESEDSILRENAPDGAAAVAALAGRRLSSVYCRASRLGVRLGHYCQDNHAANLKRFMANVEFDPFGGCWLWSAWITASGYGQTKGSGRSRPRLTSACGSNRNRWKCSRE